MLDLSPLQGRSVDDQKFLLMGLLQEAVDTPVILVGGSLVQLYTMGAVTSLDLDIVTDARQVQGVLRQAGFVEGPLSMWRHPDHAPLVNVVGAEVGVSERVTRVRFEGRVFQAVSMEDCIIDRLAGAVHWHDRMDQERVIILLRVLHDRLDFDRLFARASEENVLTQLEDAIRDAGVEPS